MYNGLQSIQKRARLFIEGGINAIPDELDATVENQFPNKQQEVRQTMFEYLSSIDIKMNQIVFEAYETD